MYIIEDVVESVVRKISGILRTGSTYFEALQGCLGENSKKLCISVETLVDWLANQNPPWSSYRLFMSFLLDCNQQTAGFLSSLRWGNRAMSFYKCVMRVTLPKATNACQDYRLCAGLKAVIDGSVYRVQYIWDAKLSTEDWGVLLVDSKNGFNEINQIGVLSVIRHLWPSRARFFFNCYCHWSLIILR